MNNFRLKIKVNQASKLKPIKWQKTKPRFLNNLS